MKEGFLEVKPLLQTTLILLPRTSHCMADTDSSRQGLKLLTLQLQTNTSSEARLFSNFWSIAVCPKPDGQSAYGRLKREKRNALTSGPGSQRRSTACPVPDTFFALSLLRASASSPTSVQPEIKQRELTGASACTHKPQCISQIFMPEARQILTTGTVATVRV